MRSPRSSSALGWKASCQRSNPPMPCTTQGSWRESSGRAGESWSASRVAGTRTWTRSKVSEGLRLETALKAEDDLKLVAYMMGGHPNRKRSVEVGKKLATSGIAALEIGIPHSDPLADGPVIQHAGQVALEHGMTVEGCLGLAAAVAKEGTPIVLMTYINPILAYDPRKFAAAAAQAGVTGVIVPDLPVEESEPVAGWLRAASLDTVFMVSPTTSQERARSCRMECRSSSRRCETTPHCRSRRGLASRAPSPWRLFWVSPAPRSSPARSFPR